MSQSNQQTNSSSKKNQDQNQDQNQNQNQSQNQNLSDIHGSEQEQDLSLNEKVELERLRQIDAENRAKLEEQNISRLTAEQRELKALRDKVKEQDKLLIEAYKAPLLDSKMFTEKDLKDKKPEELKAMNEVLSKLQKTEGSGQGNMLYAPERVAKSVSEQKKDEAKRNYNPRTGEWYA